MKRSFKIDNNLRTSIYSAKNQTRIPFSAQESCRKLLRCPHRCQFTPAETRRGCIVLCEFARPLSRTLRRFLRQIESKYAVSVGCLIFTKSDKRVSGTPIVAIGGRSRGWTHVSTARNRHVSCGRKSMPKAASNDETEAVSWHIVRRFGVRHQVQLRVSTIALNEPA